MQYEVVWPKLALTHPGTGEEHILVRGQLLPDWVDLSGTVLREALVKTGAVMPVDRGLPVVTGIAPGQAYREEA
jgi:hypothetical protein